MTPETWPHVKIDDSYFVLAHFGSFEEIVLFGYVFDMAPKGVPRVPRGLPEDVPGSDLGSPKASRILHNGIQRATCGLF